MLFRKASEDSEVRILSGVGIAAATFIVVAAVAVIANPFQERGEDQYGVVIESPYLGQGVVVGTPLMLHGVEVGKVTDVVSLPAGGGRVAAELQRGPTAGLTTAVGIDFRPANYFGVTGINLRPTGGGQVLTDGSEITVTPAGNFTLQAMLSRMGEISNGVITPQLIDVIEKGTSYLDGLDPLLETMLVVSEALANVQTVSTAQLLTNTAGVSVAFPGFVNAATTLAENFHYTFNTVSPEENNFIVKLTIDYASEKVFGAAGHLLGSHSTDLAPVTGMIQTLTDVTPGLVPPIAIGDTALELRSRLERMFSGTPDRRAIPVRVVLDSLPGVAAPLAAQGVVP